MYDKTAVATYKMPFLRAFTEIINNMRGYSRGYRDGK